MKLNLKENSILLPENPEYLVKLTIVKKIIIVLLLSL